jgi:hypothetical protein
MAKQTWLKATITSVASNSMKGRLARKVFAGLSECKTNISRRIATSNNADYYPLF